ncbi:MAG: NusG domain II-containing protein [Clostridiales bacterium]|nr:NusG domain II-containing protein [Clostridiales bacterium]
MKHFTIYDKILIFTIALISISSMVFIPFLFMDSSSDKYIVVNISGNEIHRFHLVEERELQLQEFTFVVDGAEYSAVLEIKDGRTRLRRLPGNIVPLSIHSDIGWISEPHQMIVALPIKLVITIEGTRIESDIDSISH